MPRSPPLPASVVACALALAACTDPTSPRGPEARLDGLPATIAQAVVEGGPNPSPLALFIGNPGTCTLAYTVTLSTVEGRPWLSVAPSSGSVAPGGSAPLTVTVDVVAAQLAPGTYTGSLLLAGTCAQNGQEAARSPRNVAVNLTVVPSADRCPPDFVPIPSRCGVGACARTGVITCLNGVYSDSCAPGPTAPSDATCDSVDDDCNGATDDGYVPRATACGIGHCARTGATACVNGVEIDTCTPACTPLPGEQDLPGTSCAQILRDGGSVGSGVYWLQQGAAPPYQVYCDMVTDGGGWTAVFVGKNGSPNLFDHFDEGFYLGTFADPSGNYLQRAPPSLGDSASEAAIACGSAMVKFPLTKTVRDWLVSGTVVSWTSVFPTVVAGAVPIVPNTIYTGRPVEAGFVFSRDQSVYAQTFAASHQWDATDYCNSQYDVTSVVRIFYREGAPTPVRNTVPTALRSCRSFVDAGQANGDGLYFLAREDGSTYLAYCDMTTDGGGWTSVFAARNGSEYVYAHLDDVPGYSERCTDPATNCARRAPAFVEQSAAELAVACGDAMVRFPITNPVRRWLVSGTQSLWADLTPSVIRGTVARPPNSLFTGQSATNQSFVFAQDRGGYAKTFGSGYAGDSQYDYCNGISDRVSIVRVFYREAAPTPVRNTQSTPGSSCRALRLAGSSLDGIYWLQQPSQAPYEAYCDMTTDGGGWTAVFAGRNGSPNVFGHFDATSFVETCPDPATRCLRRAPPSLGASELAVSCGDAMVGFPLAGSALAWLRDGQQSIWVALTPTVLAGVVPLPPNGVFTGLGDTNQSFVFTRDQAAFGSTFASSYESNSTFDYCNGAFDPASMVRVFYREPLP